MTPRQSAGTSKKPDHNRIAQHKPERKWGGRGDPKSHMRNIAINTKLKDNFYEGVAHRVRQKIPIK
jgi:hypothetical protein